MGMDKGDQAVLAGEPVSRTVEGHEGTEVEIIEVRGREALVQILSLPGRIGLRRVLLVDLLPAQPILF